jgi:hypothetical protein
MSSEALRDNTREPQTRTSPKTDEARADDLIPARVNAKVYKPVDPDATDIRELAKSIKTHGVLEPIVITRDMVVLSGHRRLAAAKAARLPRVPIRVVNIVSDDTEFESLLVAFNEQREKSVDEILREQVIKADPEIAYQRLVEHRRAESETDIDEIDVRNPKHRSRITKAKQPYVDAVLRVLDDLQKRRPVTVRQIHYRLLNDPPLKHASKPHSRYSNDEQSYKSLSDLLTRLRLDGVIPMSWIADETRPMSGSTGDPSVEPFIQRELKRLFSGYRRDLMQSQPNHVEIVGEKKTIESLVRSVARKYTIPYTIGRGYSSLPPLAEMVNRFQKSGKEKLIIITLSDHDPDGEEIAHSLIRTIRDDFGVENVTGVRAALTQKQAERFNLPYSVAAKTTSANYKRFAAKYGGWGWELEALDPDTLEELLHETIQNIIDMRRYEQEVEQEKQDAAKLEEERRTVLQALGTLPDNDDT